MRVSDFDYYLPEELIAQTPVEPRDAARLLVVDRETGRMEHRIFRQLPDYLRAGDVLVLNDTRVMPARLYGVKAPTGGRVEVLLLGRRGPDEWEALVRPGRRLPVGSEIVFGEGKLSARVIDRTEAGGRVLRFVLPDFLRNREKSISRPLKNMRKMKPSSDRRPRTPSSFTRFRPLLPMRSPAAISATTSGTDCHFSLCSTMGKKNAMATTIKRDASDW
ncbi:MAG: hypothetical protein BAA04_05965 [Firmicutes bacterium ZCTH02-B6]|nr:MAG: hypothetical protein BAA04_05965 [Firmicutes bacterium ZCTH02-B6]